MPALLGKSDDSLVNRKLPFQKNRYSPVAHSDAAIRKGKWKLTWPGIPETMKKDSARDNPSYRRGITEPHWEMPLDRGLEPFPDFATPKPRLYDLETDPSEKHDVSASHPELVNELAKQYDQWFDEVIKDWHQSRESIIRHDKAYWKTPAQ